MSIVRCANCEVQIDTDYDAETYREEIEQWICERCWMDAFQALYERENQ